MCVSQGVTSVLRNDISKAKVSQFIKRKDMMTPNVDTEDSLHQ